MDREGEPLQVGELSIFITEEVCRILALCQEAIEPHSRNAPPNDKTLDVPSSTHRQAPQDELAGLAFQFVRALATEAGRHLNSSDSGLAKVSSQSSQIQGPRGNLDSLRIEHWAGQVVGQTYLEDHCRIPRSTLHWWQRRNDVIALRKGARNHVFPLGQFVDGRPVPGIRQVLSSITNPRVAWLWLISPSPLLGGRIPINLLRHDLVEEVIQAAQDISRSTGPNAARTKPPDGTP